MEKSYKELKELEPLKEENLIKENVQENCVE